MPATDVIEAYIDDTVRLLPRRQRDDVATELRSLLNEQLQAQAQESGRPPRVGGVVAGAWLWLAK